MTCNRRTFIKKSSLAAAALTFASGTPEVAKGASKSMPGKEKEIPTVCALCRSRCAMVARVRGSEVRLQGNPHARMNGSSLCARGLASVQLLTDPDRLKFPLQRVGPRGSGKWQRISWKEANALIGKAMKKALQEQGPSSLALLHGGAAGSYGRRLFASLGARCFEASSAHNEHILALGYGPVLGAVPQPLVLPKAEQVDCLVMLGSHLGENVQLSQLKQVGAMLTAGTKLVVADPRFSAMAAKADFHLALRPGSDTALLLGWINFLFTDNLVDEQHLAQTHSGVAELRQHVASYTVDRVAELTGLPQDHIAATGWLIGSQPGRTWILPGSHQSWYGTDVSRVQAMAILAALVGVDHGLYGAKAFDFAKPSTFVSFDSLCGAALAGDLQLLGIWGQNPLHSQVSPYKTIEALRKVPFIFGVDLYPTDSQLYADVILPEASFLERMDIVERWRWPDQESVACRFPVQQAGHERLGPYEIAQGLAQEVGKGNLFKAKDIKEHLENQLQGLGLNLARLEQAGGLLSRDLPALTTQTGEGVQDVDSAGVQHSMALTSRPISTPSGQIELVSSWLHEQGLESLPSYVPPQQPPAGFVRLLYGRSPVHSQTGSHNLSWLNHEQHDNELWLSTETAASYKVDDGQLVWLENQDGIRAISQLRVKVTPGIREDCAYLAHGFGCRSPFIKQAFLHGESDTFLMTRGHLDPVVGVRGMRDNFIRVVQG